MRFLTSIFGLFLLASGAVAAPAAPLTGRWVMHLYLGDRLFEDQVTIERSAAGAFSGSLVVPGAFTATLENVAVDGGDFSFAITADEGHGPFHVVYRGTLHDSGDTFVGFATLPNEKNALLGGFVGQRKK